MNETLCILSRLAEPQRFPARLATLVRVQGSSYRRAGARLLVDASGSRIGSISGGCLEEDLLARMRSLSPTRPFDNVIYDTTSENDLIWGVGTGCHGVVNIVIEYLPATPDWAHQARQYLEQRKPIGLVVDWSSAGAAGTQVAETAPAATGDECCFYQLLEPPYHLVIYGAGEDARPLVTFAKALGWSVTVLDPRAELVNAGRWPEATAAKAIDPTNAGAAVAWDDRTAVVIMTHHYLHDLPLLAALLPLNLPYLGLLGPRRRAERLLRDLPSEVRATARTAIERLHAPVGLDLGGDGPEAVALAIVAEIQARLTGRDARPLRERGRGIHDA